MEGFERLSWPNLIVLVAVLLPSTTVKVWVALWLVVRVVSAQVPTTKLTSTSPAIKLPVKA